jgi:nitroreductase
MSEIQRNMIERRTVYSFLSTEIPRSVLEDAFEAARHAPCHKHTHPWKFYVMGEKTRLKIIPTVERLARQKSKMDAVPPAILERARQKILTPPALIAVTSRLNGEDAFREEEDYAASVCALHNAVLSLWEHGIGCQWSTGGITRDSEVYSALNISPSDERIIGLLKAGYPESIPSVNKKPLDEMRLYLD